MGSTCVLASDMTGWLAAREVRKPVICCAVLCCAVLPMEKDRSYVSSTLLGPRLRGPNIAYRMHRPWRFLYQHSLARPCAYGLGEARRVQEVLVWVGGPPLTQQRPFVPSEKLPVERASVVLQYASLNGIR